MSMLVETTLRGEGVARELEIEASFAVNVKAHGMNIKARKRDCSLYSMSHHQKLQQYL